VLRYRLLFGPLLIAAIFFGSWFDQWLDQQPASAWFADLTERATWPPGMVVLPVLCLLAILGALELKKIYSAAAVVVSRRVVVTLVLVGLGTVAFIPNSFSGVTAAAFVNSVVTAVLVGTLVFHSRHKQVEGAIAAAGGTLLTVVYLGMMFGFLLLIRREHSAWILLWMLITTKSSDIGAYTVGRTLGRNKLIPWLSPGKTWEGFVGGLVFAAAVGAGGVWLLRQTDSGIAPSVAAGALLGTIFAAAGQVGDLVMSLLKRDAGVKDAGRSLPGFGGILDVLDSVLLVAPIAFWLLRLTVGDATGGGNLLE